MYPYNNICPAAFTHHRRGKDFWCFFNTSHASQAGFEPTILTMLTRSSYHHLRLLHWTLFMTPVIPTKPDNTTSKITLLTSPAVTPAPWDGPPPYAGNHCFLLWHTQSRYSGSVHLTEVFVHDGVCSMTSCCTLALRWPDSCRKWSILLASLAWILLPERLCTE